MRWFGKSWGAPICDPDLWSPTPIDDSCRSCAYQFQEGDRGFILPYYHLTGIIDWPLHHHCMMEQVLGPDWQAVSSTVVEELDDDLDLLY